MTVFSAGQWNSDSGSQRLTSIPSVGYRARNLTFMDYLSIKQVNAALDVAREAWIVADYAYGGALTVEKPEPRRN